MKTKVIQKILFKNIISLPIETKHKININIGRIFIFEILRLNIGKIF